jgi:hypothetical protein
MVDPMDWKRFTTMNILQALFAVGILAACRGMGLTIRRIS